MSENKHETPEQRFVAQLEQLYAIDPLVVQIEEGKDPSVPSHEELEERHAKAVKVTNARLFEKQKTFAGYQLSQKMDFAQYFGELMDVHVNDIGDTYAEAGIRTSTKAAERAVVRYFSRLWRAPVPARVSALPVGQPLARGLEKKELPSFYNEAWACTLTLGCTEGNMYAIRNARDYLKGKFLLPELYGRPGEIPAPAGTEDVQGDQAVDKDSEPSLMPRPTIHAKVSADEAVPGCIRGGAAQGHPQATLSHPLLMRPMPASPHTEQQSNIWKQRDDATPQSPHIHQDHPSAAIVNDNEVAHRLPPLRMIRAHRTPGVHKSKQRAGDAQQQPQQQQQQQQQSQQSSSTAQDMPAGLSLGERMHLDERHRERALEAEAAMEARRGANVDTDSTTAADAAAEWESDVSHQHSYVVHEPVLLYGAVAHYSIDKIRDLLELHTPETLGNTHYPGQCPLTQHLTGALRGAWPAKVPVHIDGRIQIDALVALAKFFTSRGHPILVSLTYGTTFSGVHEDPARVYRALKEAGCLHQDTYRYVVHRATGGDAGAGEVERLHYVLQRRNYWIHVDGALGAWYGGYFNQEDSKRRAATAKLVGMAEEELPRLPAFDFGVGVGDQVDSHESPMGGAVMSIAMSGHKQCGMPFPTGVVMTLRRYMLDYQAISYIAAGDTTLAGSRNGHSPLLMWSAIARMTDADHIRNYLRQAQLARDLAQTLAQTLGCNVNEYGGLVFLSAHALAVVYPRPTQETIDRFSLSCDLLRYSDPGEGFPGNKYFSVDKDGKPQLDRPCSVGNDPDKEGQGRCVGRGMWAEDLPAAHTFVMAHVTEELACELVRALRDDALVQQAVRKYKARVEKAGGSLPRIYDERGALLDVWGREVEPPVGPIPPGRVLDIDKAASNVPSKVVRKGDEMKFQENKHVEVRADKI